MRRESLLHLHHVVELDELLEHLAVSELTLIVRLQPEVEAHAHHPAARCAPQPDRQGRSLEKVGEECGRDCLGRIWVEVGPRVREALNVLLAGQVHVGSAAQARKVVEDHGHYQIKDDGHEHLVAEEEGHGPPRAVLGVAPRLEHDGRPAVAREALQADEE